MPRARRSQKNRDNEIDSMSLLEVATQLKEEILGLQEQVKQLKEEIITLQQYRDQIQQGRGDQINMSPKECLQFEVHHLNNIWKLWQENHLKSGSSQQKNQHIEHQSVLCPLLMAQTA